jgi:hypothetical protein
VAQEKETGEGKKNLVQRKGPKRGKRLSGVKTAITTKPTPTRESKTSKRKPTDEGAVDDCNKSPKRRASMRAMDIASLKSLQKIPKTSSQPAEVYKIFLDRGQNEDLCWLLTRLFFAIASPDAFYRLRDACRSAREIGGSTIEPTNNVAQTIQALDNLEIAASANSILRRCHLTRLVKQRNERESYHKDHRPERALRRVKDSSEGYGRASSLALADLMAQAYPELKPGQRGRGTLGNEYQIQLRSLKNRLNSGRNWHLMQQRFLPRILALVPTGGDCEIHNYEYVSSTA